MMSADLRDIVILNFHGTDYYHFISRTSKNEAMNLVQNIDFTKKADHYKK